MSVATLDGDRCPDCGGALTPIITEQPAIVRHGGYGATRRDTVKRCGACGWALHSDTTEVRP